MVGERSCPDLRPEFRREASHNSEAGLGEQGTAAAGELGGQNAPTELRIDHAEAKDDSAPPAVESVLNAKDGESEKSAATKVVAPEEQQDGDNAPAQSSGSDEPPRHAESHDDTSVTTADPVINADEGNHDHAAITELVEQDGSNVHDHVDQIADSCTSAPEIDADGSKGLQIEALTIEPEVLDGSDCEATSKGPSEEEVVANGLDCSPIKTIVDELNEKDFSI
ncbi:hypothetical protein D1007_36942 [Hordeum vulgare]|nr:hypothetical protein D1007_36942 [Hordeum vulgare]